MQVSSRTDEINAGCHDRESIVFTAVYMHIIFYACTNLWLRKFSTAKKVHAWMHSGYRPSCRRRYRLLTESYPYNYNDEEEQACKKSRDNLSFITGEQTNSYIVSNIGYIDEYSIAIAIMYTFYIICYARIHCAITSYIAV